MQKRTIRQYALFSKTQRTARISVVFVQAISAVTSFQIKLACAEESTIDGPSLNENDPNRPS